MNTALPLGKVNPTLLTELIDQLPIQDHNLIIPPGVGRDAAGITIGNSLMAISTDPITLASERIAIYSVAVNINDVACLGCRPLWYSGSILLPEGTTEKQLREIWKNLVIALNRYGIHDIGGHTEVTSAVNQPVIVGQMIGEAISNTLLNPSNGRADDDILLWQKGAIEGTALLANECEDILLEEFNKETVTRMQNFIDEPGICIWPCVEKLVPQEGLVALHDPTEGGIATALHELADAANCGLRIDGDSIPLLPETEQLADLFGIDPLGLLASGSLLIVCRNSATQTILEKLDGEPITQIGKLSKTTGRKITFSGKQKTLPRYEQDQVMVALDKYKKTKAKEEVVI